MKKSFEELSGNLDAFLAPCLSQDWPNFPVEKAEGVYVYDKKGRQYLDFLCGFGACNVGHNHPEVVKAAKDQIDKFVHTAIGVTHYEPLILLTQELKEILPGNLDMFFFGNSGAEAVEGALKVARYTSGRSAIISFIGGFHGRTIGATSVGSSKAKYRTGHGGLLPDIHFCQYPYPYRSRAPEDPEISSKDALEDLNRIFEYIVEPKDVAGILVEPIQGEGGYIFPPKSFLKTLRKICDDHGIYLIFDEVQSGFGRTGEWFASDVYDVYPDIIAIAKAIANGFPLGATIANSEIMKKWGAVSHGTTCGGNPVSCAAALKVIEVIKKENLLENAKKQGKYLLDKLKELKKRSTVIGDVRGVGLMTAAEFVKPGTDREPNPEIVKKVLNIAFENGLLLYPCGHWSQTIRLIPALTVTAEQIDKGMSIFSKAVLATERGI